MPAQTPTVIKPKLPTVITPAHANSQQSSHLHIQTPNSHHTCTHKFPTVITPAHKLPTVITPAHKLPTVITPAHKLPTVITPAHTNSQQSSHLHTNSQQSSHLHTQTPNSHHTCTQAPNSHHTCTHKLPKVITPAHTNSQQSSHLHTNSQQSSHLHTQTPNSHHTCTQTPNSHHTCTNTLPTVTTPAHTNSQQSSHLHKHTPNSHHANTNTLPTVRRVKLHQRVMLTLYCQNVSTFLHFFSRTNPTLHLLAQILLGLWEGICWELLGTKRVKGNNFASANTHTHTSTSNKHQLNTLFSNKNVEQYRWQSWPTWPIISIFLNLKENFCASYVHLACAAMDFSPRGQFSMQTITVSVQPMCTTACINMRTHIKILNAGNQTTVWIHENTAHTDRNR